jgi:hypothetical protein
LFREPRKNYNQQQNTKNSNYKQQLLTNKRYSSAVSSVGPPLSLPKGEHKRDQELVNRRRRSMTLTIDNAPACNNRGIDKETRSTTTTVTGSLLQKPVTLAAANLGSCDNNPGEADTTIDTGAIFAKEGGSLQSWFDPRDDGAKSGRGADKGGIRPAALKHSKI